MRTTVRLPDDLVARAKEKAHREGTTLTALIAEGLRLVVAKTAQRPKRVAPPPVSKARGGLRPGLRWDRLKDYDLADMENVPIEKLR
jgi:hypothetical protein